jgi:hypothetical protein
MPKDGRLRTGLKLGGATLPQAEKEITMRDRSLGSMITVTLTAAAASTLLLSFAMAQAPAKSDAAQNSAVKTPWGEPDLQGIWTDETDTPLQRPAKYANQEFFTTAQREELDQERSALLRRDKRWSAARNWM